MGKINPLNLMLTWNSKSGEQSALDRKSPNYNKFGNSTSGIHHRLIYFHARYSFYYKFNFSQDLHGKWRKVANATKIRNVFDGDA
jgi:hypothetical protein